MKSMEITAVGIDVSKSKSTVAIRRPGGVIENRPCGLLENRQLCTDVLE